jgi:Xaa-Pro aminopeptidase
MPQPDLTAIASRLAAVREAMARQRIDALLVPSADPHLSEYLPARWQGREWLSGFTGSVGTLIVTAHFAGVWTDARYWTQAENELAGTGIALMKIPSGGSTLYVDWLADTMTQGQVVATDGAVLGLAIARLLEQKLAQRDIVLHTETDVLDDVWPDRPGLPQDPVFELPAPYAAVPREEKLAALRAAMAAHGAAYHVISTLDDIAWLFNLRGADVHFNPVFVAHAVIAPQRATLYVAEHKIPAGLVAALAAAGVDVAPYGEFAAALGALPESATVLLDPRRVTYGTRQALPAGITVVEAINPTTLAKAQKTSEEAQHVRATMEQDGAALCEFLCWLDAQLADSGPGQAPLTEVALGEQLTQTRARRAHFISPSFGTIAGFNANGAIMHYRAKPADCAVVAGDGLLLIDSGGQYLGGTTDVTRVVPVGAVSDEQRRDFTLVLKGLIALSRARFPHGVKSPMLDAIARAPLWAEGIDFGHGTGHGVGFFLNVHEGPQSISPSTLPEPQTAMLPGMITSIEPGVYRPGQWGIRIENLVLNVGAGETAFGAFLQFETLTLCPIDTRCIDASLLRADERQWLNDYHTVVRTRLAPLLDGDALAWLHTRTEAL